MHILLISDDPSSEKISEIQSEVEWVLPFAITPFDSGYLEENTDPPEDVKIFKYRLHEADAVVFHPLSNQSISDFIAWGKLKSHDWSHLESATVIREDGDSLTEAEMCERLSEVVDEELEREYIDKHNSPIASIPKFLTEVSNNI